MPMQIPGLSRLKTRIARAGTTAVFCSAIVLGGTAQAELGGQPATQAPGAGAGAPQGQQIDPQVMQQLQQSQQRLQQLQHQLGQLQEDTLENDPALLEQLEELETLAIATMERMGHNPQTNVERLDELRGELQAAQDDPERQQALFQEAQVESQALQAAQQDAMQDEQLMAAQEQFQDDLLTQMRERHPEVDDLLAEFQDLQQEMVQLQQGGMR